MPVIDYGRVLQVLAANDVRFILIGGLAAIVHGSPRLTLDVDVVYERTNDNIRKLADALRPYSPYMRGVPPGLPFIWDEQTIAMGLNFTLVTALGDLDLLGEVAGGGTYEKLLPHSSIAHAFGVELRCVNLDKLIHLKRAAGRAKDLMVLAELESLLASSQQPPKANG